MECSASIFRYDNKYYYTLPIIYYPHECSISNGVPYGEYVGYIHTHPNSADFSNADKSAAISLGGCAYLVTPYYSVKKYISNTTSTIGNSTPIDLTESQKNMLVYNYSDNWYNHFVNGECPDNFDCEDKIWPNGG